MGFYNYILNFQQAQIDSGLRLIIDVQLSNHFYYKQQNVNNLTKRNFCPHKESRHPFLVWSGPHTQNKIFEVKNKVQNLFRCWFE